jgi:hypothetical protein
MGQTLGEHQTFHLVILADTVIAPSGIEDPVADIYQIQQTPELLLCHFDLHMDTPPRRRRGLYCMQQYNRPGGKIPLKKPGKSAKFSLEKEALP